MARLGDICTVNMGQSPDSATYNEVGRGLPFFQGNADFGRLHPAVRVWCSEPTKIAHTGDILISVRAPIGAMNVADQDCCIGRGLAAIQVNENICDPQYLWYAIQSKVSDLNAKGTGSTFKAISKNTLTDTEILLVTLDAQKKIARILSNVENSILFRKEQLSKLDELIKARFVELTESVNTAPTRMGDIATYINGYAFKPIDWKESGLPIIRIQNLNDASAKYNYFDGEIDSKYLVTTGDVLVSWATHLEAYIWNGRNAWLNQHIFKVLFNKMPINKIYFVYATEDALRQAFKNAHGFKPTMEHIKRSDFENATVKLPAMEIQNQFAAFVEEVDKSKVEVQKALDQTQLLFDSLMQQYFR